MAEAYFEKPGSEPGFEPPAQAHALSLALLTMPAMDTSNVIDLASFRLARQRASLPTDAREALEERQRETIEKLRALGYEMSVPRKQVFQRKQ